MINEDLQIRLFSYKITKRLHEVIKFSKRPFITKNIISYILFKEDSFLFENFKFIDYDLIQLCRIEDIIKQRIILTEIAE